jgi:hypothetical protein
MWSIGKSVHRIVGKGRDPSGLGRWVWTRYRGRDQITIRIFMAYRPNPPTEGPCTVYAQHRHFLNTRQDDRCPRQAFLEDLCKDIHQAQQEGDNILVMLDGNEDSRSGDLHNAFFNIQLHEAILNRHGTDTPATYNRNQNRKPIDGIWSNISLTITAGGFCAFDQVLPGTNHRTVWVEMHYKEAFGHIMPAIIKHQARRLQCKDPRCVDNFIRRYKQHIIENKLWRKRNFWNPKAPFLSHQINKNNMRNLITCDALARLLPKRNVGNYVWDWYLSPLLCNYT